MTNFQNSTLPQCLSFEAFQKQAVLTKLTNHGRVGVVVFQGCNCAFVDALGIDGMRQAHRAVVNNALYANTSEAPAALATALPSLEALADYPELAKKYPKLVERIKAGHTAPKIMVGEVGFYRPDPSGPHAVNIAVEIREERISVYEVRTGVLLTMNRDDWMPLSEMESSLQSVVAGIQTSNDPEMELAKARGRISALADAVKAKDLVENVLRPWVSDTNLQNA